MNIFTAKRDLSKQSTQVRLCEACSKEEEVQYILRDAKKAVNVGQTAAVLIPTQNSIISFVQLVLKSEGKNEWNVVTNEWGKTDYNSLNRYLA